MVLELKEFIEDCKNGSFIDYDGFGYYSNSKTEHDDNDELRVYPSQITDGRSLKAVPTQVEEDHESLDECIEKCWHHIMNSEIKRCTKECIKE